MTARRSVLTMFAALSLAASLGACATSGATFTEANATLPAPAAGTARMFIYRTAVLGAAVQPAIKVNGDVVGAAIPLGFIYLDRPAGDYKISTSTEVERALSLSLATGQVRYVRLNVSFGFFVGHVYPELMDAAEGLKEIASCRLQNG